MTVPTGATEVFARSLVAIGARRRDDVYWSGRATLIRRPEDIPVYDRAFATFFAMFAYIYQQYPGLPDTIALSFPKLSGVTRVGSKDELLKLPIAGVSLLLINLGLGFVAHAWERMVGYVLLTAAIAA